MRRYLFPGLCVFALVLALHTLTLASGPSTALAVEAVEITTAAGEQHVFRAFIADTEETRSRGLMWVSRLDADQGMLFDFGSPRRVAMWMKNTPLSLDLLFIDADGRITRIEARARPFSREIIDSRAKVLAVLEINGGMADKLGIAAGDRVAHRLFD